METEKTGVQVFLGGLNRPKVLFRFGLILLVSGVMVLGIRFMVHWLSNPAYQFRSLLLVDRGRYAELRIRYPVRFLNINENSKGLPFYLDVNSCGPAESHLLVSLDAGDLVFWNEDGEIVQFPLELACPIEGSNTVRLYISPIAYSDPLFGVEEQITLSVSVMSSGLHRIIERQTVLRIPLTSHVGYLIFSFFEKLSLEFSVLSLLAGGGLALLQRAIVKAEQTEQELIGRINDAKNLLLRGDIHGIHNYYQLIHEGIGDQIGDKASGYFASMDEYLRSQDWQGLLIADIIKGLCSQEQPQKKSFDSLKLLSGRYHQPVSILALLGRIISLPDDDLNRFKQYMKSSPDARQEPERKWFEVSREELIAVSDLQLSTSGQEICRQFLVALLSYYCSIVSGEEKLDICTYFYTNPQKRDLLQDSRLSISTGKQTSILVEVYLQKKIAVFREPLFLQPSFVVVDGLPESALQLIGKAEYDFNKIPVETIVSNPNEQMLPITLPVVVWGGAGSGKTTAAFEMYRARFQAIKQDQYALYPIYYPGRLGENCHRWLVKSLASTWISLLASNPHLYVCADASIRLAIDSLWLTFAEAQVVCNYLLLSGLVTARGSYTACKLLELFEHTEAAPLDSEALDFADRLAGIRFGWMESVLILFDVPSIASIKDWRGGRLTAWWQDMQLLAIRLAERKIFVRFFLPQEYRAELGDHWLPSGELRWGPENIKTMKDNLHVSAHLESGMDSGLISTPRDVIRSLQQSLKTRQRHDR